ncbi:hypothetical protein ANAPC5_01446 [Anaplasma phagocytophilum]|nr:hypothetical protein ANAPC5_01446 [Anaplasma phagocytophilum]
MMEWFRFSFSVFGALRCMDCVFMAPDQVMFSSTLTGMSQPPVRRLSVAMRSVSDGTEEGGLPNTRRYSFPFVVKLFDSTCESFAR